MMKRLRQITLLAILCFSVWSIAAQNNTTQRLTLLQALAIVQTGDPNLNANRFIVDGGYDEDDACWKFEYSDTSEICVSDTTGALVDFDDNSNSGVPAPAATEDVTSGGIPAPAATEDADNDIFTVQPTILLNDAIVTALRIFPNRIVSDFELERNADGVVVWEIKLDNNTVSVDVDAETGFVLDFGRSDDNDDDISGSSGRGRGSDDDISGSSGRGRGSSGDDDDDNSGRGGSNSGSSDSDDDDNSGRGGSDSGDSD